MFVSVKADRVKAAVFQRVKFITFLPSLTLLDLISSLCGTCTGIEIVGFPAVSFSNRAWRSGEMSAEPFV